MSTLYITTQGSNVQKRSGQFLVCKGADIIQNVPETQIHQIVLVGNINLSTPAVSFCLEKDIEVVYLSQGGKFKGRLVGNSRRSAELRVRQYDLVRDPRFRLQMVKAVTAGKIRNQIDLAARLGEANSSGIATLRALLMKSGTAASVESLLGIEGAASAAYFKMFRRWIPAPWVFERRSSNPPRDPVNALLSLSYTLIYNRLESLVNLAGLDPFQGFFHMPKDGHASLASDLTEEFRSIFCDALVLRLLRRKQLSPSHFERVDTRHNLTKEGSKIFFGEFEAKISSNRRINGGESVSFQEIMRRQIYLLARVVKGKEDIYRPFSLRSK